MFRYASYYIKLKSTILMAKDHMISDNDGLLDICILLRNRLFEPITIRSNVPIVSNEEVEGLNPLSLRVRLFGRKWVFNGIYFQLKTTSEDEFLFWVYGCVLENKSKNIFGCLVCMEKKKKKNHICLSHKIYKSHQITTKFSQNTTKSISIS